MLRIFKLKDHINFDLYTIWVRNDMWQVIIHILIKKLLIKILILILTLLFFFFLVT